MNRLILTVVLAISCSAANAQATSTRLDPITVTAPAAKAKGCAQDWRSCTGEEILQARNTFCGGAASLEADDAKELYGKMTRPQFVAAMNKDCGVTRTAQRAPDRDDDETAEGSESAQPVAFRPGGSRKLSPAQRQQLNQLRDVESEELMGPRPDNSRGFIPTAPRGSAVHANCRGGRVTEKVPTKGGYYARVDGCR